MDVLPHPESSLLDEDELSSIASDTSGYLDRHRQATELLDNYEVQSENDRTKMVLQAALKYLPVSGSMIMMEEIIQFEGDENKYRQLANFFIDAILKPLRFCGPPEEITSSPTPGAAQEIETLMTLIISSTRDAQPALKQACLRRDGSCCVITGHVDSKEVNKGHVDQAGRIPTPTQCAHIIPFGLRKLGDERVAEVEKKATIWWALHRYFPSLQRLICAESINQPGNAMTLSVTMHEAFNNFWVALKPLHERRNVYRVKNFSRVSYFGLPKEISFSSSEPAVPIPREEFLRAHFAVASILEVSGIGARINECLSQDFWDNIHGSAKADGSTPLAELVARKLLIGV